jgi:hypothetical protein
MGGRAPPSTTLVEAPKLKISIDANHLLSRWLRMSKCALARAHIFSVQILLYGATFSAHVLRAVLYQVRTVPGMFFMNAPPVGSLVVDNANSG